jgi:hypothetical protein
MKFSFETNELTYRYCTEIVRCLQLYCNKSNDEAIQLLNKYWDNEPLLDENDIRFHEYPYFWAMCITHSGNPEWWRDSALWPPPQDYVRQALGLG